MRAENARWVKVVKDAGIQPGRVTPAQGRAGNATDQSLSRTSRVCWPGVGRGERISRRRSPNCIGKPGIFVAVPSGSVSATMPPAFRCGSSKRSPGSGCGEGQAVVLADRLDLGDAVLLQQAIAPAGSACRDASSGRCWWRTRARRARARRARGVKSSHWRSVTTPMKSARRRRTRTRRTRPRPSCRRTSAPAPCPVTTCCIMCVETSHAAVLERGRSARTGPAGASRSRSAARMAMAPNMPPIMSFTGAPARSGRPGAGHVGEAAHHLHDLVQRGALLVRARRGSP